jgi:4-carboxymuconolactone decarboxylase
MSEDRSRAERALDALSTIGGSEEGGRTLAGFLDAQGAVGRLALWTGAGEIWTRPGLSRRDRSVVVISTLTALARETELRQHVAGGLNHGLSIEEADEIMVQIAAYAGLPFALAGARIVDSVVAEREGGSTRQAPHVQLDDKSDAQRRADGLDVLSTLIGDPNLDRAATEKAILDSQGDMGVLVMDYAFGDVWARPQLSRRDRSLVVISVLTALNMKHELEIHLGGALNHGLTPAEIVEVMITMVAYGGFPRAIDGLLLAQKVFEARGLSA